jgi:glycosyltransferase involved in cell wall biosynthesis
VVERLLHYSDRFGDGSFKVVVVDDGSTDDSRQIAESFLPNVNVVSNPCRRGYGAALVAGVMATNAQYVAFFDGDGQHTLEGLDAVLAQHGAFDMVVGARRRFEEPLIRRLGRKLIGALAGYLVDAAIPDLNSGLRVVDREKFLEFERLLPCGFSLSSTVTLAFIKRGYSVGYVPIDIERRKGGRSTVNILRDGRQTAGLIVRLIMLFAPQKIFVPVATILFVFGATSFAFEAYTALNIGENTVLLLISSLLVFLFGLLADQVAAIRRELRSR